MEVKIREFRLAPEEALDEPQRSMERKPQTSKALGVLSANATLLAWLVFLGFGGALLISYYCHIHYFPDVEWKDSFIYLAAMSIVGGCAVGIYSLLLYFPGVIWSEFLISDADLQDHFSYLDHQKKNRHPCFASIIRHIVAPFSAFIVAVHLAMLVDLRLVLETSALGLLGIAWYSYQAFPKLLYDSKTHNPLQTDASEQSLRTKYVTVVAVSSLSTVAALLVLYALIDPSGHSKRLLIACTIVTVVSNFLVAVQFRGTPGRAVLTGILVALVLLLYSEFTYNDGTALSMRIMQSLGLGAGPDVTLVLTDAGREILLSHKLTVDPLAHGATLRDARLLSRLGSEYFVETQGHALTIPRGMVVSWSTTAPQIGAPKRSP